MSEQVPTPPPSELPSYRPSMDDETAMLLVRLEKKMERKIKRRNGFALKFGAAALAISTVNGAFWADVNENRAEQEAAEVSVRVMHEPINPEDSHSATIFIDGFNMYDADFIADKLGPGAQQIGDGEVWSLSYNNALLNREKIFEQLDAKVKERHITDISFVGYSMGGIIATEAAADFVTKTDTDVNVITMLHTPDGDAGLQDYQKKELGLSQVIAEHVPGAIDSTWARFGAEMYFNKFAYTQGFGDWWNLEQNTDALGANISNFASTVDYVHDRIQDPKQTSTQLLSQQVYKIDQFDMKKELNAITKQRDKKQMPVELYFNMDNDYMVNDWVSSNNFATYAADSGIDYFSYTVPRAVHSQFYKTIGEYSHTFGEASADVSNAVALEEARHEVYLAQQADPNRNSIQAGK